MDKRWIIKESAGTQIGGFARRLDLHPLVAKVLYLRGYEDVQGAQSFLDAKLNLLPHPHQMLNAQKAAQRIADAMERSETICIYGDYDVDGVTSTSLLVEFFRKAGYPVRFYLPSRIDEGYGFHQSNVEQMSAEGVNLVITVDTGISGHEACKKAKELGMTVIVTDHHEILGELPDASAVINPHQPGCGFHTEQLAGVGIAFFLAAALRIELIERNKISAEQIDLKQFLDLVTLGTVADVAPIVGVNRLLIKYGLRLISSGDRPGIKALKEVAHLTSKKILCGHVSFQIGPRINAAGRMGDANLGVDLLTGQDYPEALRIAEILEKENQKRQLVEGKILEEARGQLLGNKNRDQLHSIVLAGKDWHPGVIGIVASRIQEEFYRPTILITFDGEVGRGSARSITDFNIFKAIDECSEYLEGFGGHQYAAGVQIKPEQLTDFATSFEKIARKELTGDDLVPRINIESNCELGQIDARLIKSLGKLAPYGVGNPEPIFMTRDAQVMYKKVVGRTHLKLRLANGNDNVTAIAFGMGNLADEISERIDIAYTVGMNEYQGHSEIQLTIKDIKPV